MQTDPSVSHAANPAFARPGSTGFDRTPVGVHGHPQAAQPATSGPGAVNPLQHAKPSSGTSFSTGAYQPSGDPMIDRMISLERALKQFGNVI
ncbi:MAG: hypothetical protein H7123_07675 [Thermoleophilia bacterium]|nr:hypothetical protein [Thermoleophilia bacterium]